jgi:hypothetical protein
MHRNTIFIFAGGGAGGGAGVEFVKLKYTREEIWTFFSLIL